MEEKSTHLKYFGIGRILPFLRSVRGKIFVMVFFGLVSSATDIILPLFQRYALDHFVGLGRFDTLIWFLAAYILTILAASGSNYISCALATIIEMRVNRQLRQTGFNHLQTLSFSNLKYLSLKISFLLAYGIMSAILGSSERSPCSIRP